jgi:hypothetical protein
VSPAIAALWGQSGQNVIYTLQVSNTIAFADTFDVSVSGSAWPVTVTTPIGPVSGHAGTPVTVTVLIPSNVLGGASDVVTITVASQTDPTRAGAAALTTMSFYQVYLPAAIHVVQ